MRFCLQQVNDEAANNFEADDDSDVNSSLELMNRLVLPCLSSLQASATAGADEDDDVADIKNKWCMFLNNDNLASEYMQKLVKRLF